MGSALAGNASIEGGENEKRRTLSVGNVFDKEDASRKT